MVQPRVAGGASLYYDQAHIDDHDQMPGIGLTFCEGQISQDGISMGICIIGTVIYEERRLPAKSGLDRPIARGKTAVSQNYLICIVLICIVTIGEGQILNYD